MSTVRKYKALGEMVPRPKVGGGEFVRLEDYEALQAENAALQQRLVVWKRKAHEDAESEELLQSRLAKAAAIIDYVEQHIELDAILTVDIPAFRAGSVVNPEVERLQSELTKVRELLNLLYWGNLREPTEADCVEIERQINAGLAHQSAPAANFIACKVDESCGRDGRDE